MINSQTKKPEHAKVLKGEPQFLQALIAHYIHQDSLFWAHVRLLFVVQAAIMAAIYAVTFQTSYIQQSLHCIPDFLAHVDWGRTELIQAFLILFQGVLLSFFVLFAMLRCLKSRNLNIDAIRVLSSQIISKGTLSIFRTNKIDEPYFKIFPPFRGDVTSKLTSKTVVPAYIVLVFYLLVQLVYALYITAANSSCS